MLALVAITSIGLVAYSYLLYPLVLVIFAAAAQMLRDARYPVHKRDRRLQPTDDLPPVAVVIAAYNEERHIAARIANLHCVDYPEALLNFYIGSDGSSDGTAKILAAAGEARLHGFAFDTNRGKASVLNDLVARVTEPIVVFSDANTRFDRNAIGRLVAHFADSRVGAVSGELRLRSAAQGHNQDSLYWRTEQFLKFFEARIHGLLGANGAIYAIRRPLWRPLAPHTICDDFCIAMNVAAAGYRLVYEPQAWAEEDTPETIGEEYRRRVRIGIGNFQALVWHPEYLVRTTPATRFTYVSHKVLRWIGPHLLLVGLLASSALASSAPRWAAFAGLQMAGYASAALLYVASERGVRLPSLLRIAAFVFALNWAFLVASWRFVMGRYSGSWRRSSR